MADLKKTIVNAATCLTGIVTLATTNPVLALSLAERFRSQELGALGEMLADLSQDPNDEDCVRVFRRYFNKAERDAYKVAAEWADKTAELDGVDVELRTLPAVTVPPQLAVISGSNNVVVQVTPGSTVVFKS